MGGAFRATGAGMCASWDLPLYGRLLHAGGRRRRGREPTWDVGERPGANCASVRPDRCGCSGRPTAWRWRARTAMGCAAAELRRHSATDDEALLAPGGHWSTTFAELVAGLGPRGRRPTRWAAPPDSRWRSPRPDSARPARRAGLLGRTEPAVRPFRDRPRRHGARRSRDPGAAAPRDRGPPRGVYATTDLPCPWSPRRVGIDPHPVDASSRGRSAHLAVLRVARPAGSSRPGGCCDRRGRNGARRADRRDGRRMPATPRTSLAAVLGRGGATVVTHSIVWQYIPTDGAVADHRGAEGSRGASRQRRRTAGVDPLRARRMGSSPGRGLVAHLARRRRPPGRPRRLPRPLAAPRSESPARGPQQRALGRRRSGTVGPRPRWPACASTCWSTCREPVAQPVAARGTRPPVAASHRR